MTKKFAEHSGLDLTKVNNEILEMWNKNDIFHKSIDEREGCPQFVFFEGPPSANGHPGIHHVLARSIKDTFNRYKTMKGMQVHRKAGWYILYTEDPCCTTASEATTRFQYIYSRMLYKDGQDLRNIPSPPLVFSIRP